MKQVQRRLILWLLGLLWVWSFSVLTVAQGQTVGVMFSSINAHPGYTLFAPNRSKNTYLINNAGEVIHRWQSDYLPGFSVHLKENGSLVRAGNPGGSSPFISGGNAGVVQEFTWDGTLVWEFFYSNTEYRAHHDIAVLPNGNVLMIAWEYKNLGELAAAGRNPQLLTANELWPDKIIEVKPTPPTGEIVWEWHVWDHLVQDFDPTKENYGDVAAHPERVDVNFSPLHQRPDWLHMNAVDYHAGLDQIVVSVRDLGEFWIIDHSTTTEEAATRSGGRSGRGGDLLYRWGNPQAYRAGLPEDQKLFMQHGTHWIPEGLPGAGNVLTFNNGNERPDGTWSSVDEVVPPVDTEGNYEYTPGAAYGPSDLTWTYAADPPEIMHSRIYSGAQRQPNGNTLICIGRYGVFLEVTSEGERAWQYNSPIDRHGSVIQGKRPDDNSLFMVARYDLDYPAFAGKDLMPNGTLERDPNAIFLLSVAQLSSVGVGLEWTTVPDRNYGLQRSSSLHPSDWVGISTQTAIGTLSRFLDTNLYSPNHSPEFYRVLELGE